MATATDTYAKVEEKVTDLVSTVSEPVVANVRKVADVAEKRINDLELPAVESLPSTDELVAKADELVEKYFAFAQTVLDRQHELAKQVLEQLGAAPAKAKTAAKTATSQAKAATTAAKPNKKATKAA
ncbi:MAG: hypothetical protein KDB35_01065 [Acidimicrobiales bacterium]|nr:hypothetical protein [Acidimicrobiales bacterium]